MPRHGRPRRKTFHPYWKYSELSQFEVEPYKAMFYQEAKVEQPQRRKTVRRSFDHETTPPKDIGYWWVGSTWFRTKRVNP
eukprot:2523232-Prorocentrum_lima.AAC.1